MARDPQPDDFVGKTIVAVDTRSCNIWQFSFSDGSSISIEADVLNTEGGTIPVMQVCTECAPTRHRVQAAQLAWKTRIANGETPEEIMKKMRT